MVFWLVLLFITNNYFGGSKEFGSLNCEPNTYILIWVYLKFLLLVTTLVALKKLGP
jgi:hypothetical protein